MPIQSCTLPGGKKGHKWGGQGKCYRSRAAAERQAEAAYAHGYKGDAANDAAPLGVAAGVLLERTDKRIFLCKRSGSGDHAGKWALPGGGVESKEDSQKAAARELFEETGYVVEPSLLQMTHIDIGTDVDFITYLLQGVDDFTPQLNDEHTACGWFERDDLPNPLHPCTKRMLCAAVGIQGALDSNSLAMDRQTTRTTDTYGRLHVELTNISKATVNPYYGREIPKWQELGLEAGRVYYLLRDPTELAKAAPTFNKIPLLIKHVGHSSLTPQKQYTVGTLGESGVFAPPYLQNTLCVWDAGAIAGIETDEQRELSCSYSYRADMTPGVYEGTHYDGVMRDIVGNHVALVMQGRAGADVVVGDSKLVERATMKKAGIYAVRTALSMHLRPALANDAAPIPLRDLVQPGMTPSQIADNVKKQYGKQFAVDTSAIAELVTLARDEAEDMEDEEEEAEDEETEDEKKEREEKEEEEEKARDERAKARDKKKGKAKDGKTAKDRKEAKDAKEAKDRKEAKDGPPAGPKGPRDRAEGKGEDEAREAHDAALRSQFRQEQRELRDAEADVRPLVGQLAAMDSAEDVYRAALTQLKVNIKGVHASAFPALLQAQKQLRTATRSPSLAHDGALRTNGSNVKDLIPTAVKPGRA
jgi:8-oxo-dGTP pyrophosphatase MutT (NUDIX family)